MKNLLVLLLLIPTPALAGYHQGGGVEERECFETIYTEEYIPGNSRRPGRVITNRERIQVPCREEEPRSHYLPADPPSRSNVDDNSCIEGSIIGGIAGGAIGGAAATQENWIWSIPAGVIGGAVVGCQIDGG